MDLRYLIHHHLSVGKEENESTSVELPAASATADPTMAPVALLARAEAICKKVKCLSTKVTSLVSIKFTINWHYMYTYFRHNE